MDKVQRQLLYCLKAYRLGQEQAESAGLSEDGEWAALSDLAVIHKMAPIVYEMMGREPEFCGQNAALRSSWRRSAILQSVGQTTRSAKIVQVSTRFRENGIRHALVKGLLCRELYAKPDLRLSGDEDLFIAPADKERCRPLLEDMGLVLMTEFGEEDVLHWNDPATGLHIELHARLLPDDEMNRQFEQQLAHTVTVPVTGGEVDTFAPTWHFVFLVCHALKHFLTGGFGVRTLADILSFAERWNSEIDWEKAGSLLDEVSGRVFLDQVFAVGEQELGFALSRTGWTYSCTPEPEELLMDCVEAGVYGQSSMSRKHSANLVLNAAREKSRVSGVLNSLFPDRASMEHKYPVLKEHPGLLPICWMKRIFRYAEEVRTSSGKEDSPLESIALGKKRTEMMVKYGVFPKSKRKD